jgi:hypothetical protein
LDVILFAFASIVFHLFRHSNIILENYANHVFIVRYFSCDHIRGREENIRKDLKIASGENVINGYRG